MNLHYIMQGLPTVIIYPIKRGDSLSIETATWGYQLGQSHMIMDKTFRIPMSRIEGLLTHKYRGLIIQSQSVADTMLIGQEEIKKLENTIES